LAPSKKKQIKAENIFWRKEGFEQVSAVRQWRWVEKMCIVDCFTLGGLKLI
jgi:hypothetical protein